MMHHTRSVLALALLLGSALAPVAQETTAPALSFDSVVRAAVAHDAELLGIRRTVEDALDELGWPGRADDVTLSLGGALSGNDFASMGTDAEASLSANLQILPQLTIGGSLGANYNDPQTPESPDPLVASVRFTLKPLADAHGRARDELALERAQAQLAERARAVSLSAIRALFDLLEAEDALAIAELEAEIASQREETSRALAARDRATADEVRTAADAHRLARQNLERLRLAADQARWSLGARVGMPPHALPTPDWDALGLDDEVQRIRRTATSIDTGEIASVAYGVLVARLDVRAAQIEAAATPVFAPEIAATAGVSYPGPGYSLGLNVSASLSDLNAVSARRATADVGLAELALEAEAKAAEYAARAATLDLRIALENMEAATRDVGLAQAYLTEAEFRFGRGDATALTVAQARRDVEEAKAGERTAQAAVVKAWYRVELLQL